MDGWIALIMVGGLLTFGLLFLAASAPRFATLPLATGTAVLAVGLVCSKGFFTLQQNEAAVMVFFGSYAGSASRSGLHWVNPFYLKRRLSLRMRNFATPILKVNDARGNPIEIGATLSWRVADTAAAAFEVEDYDHYVRVQSESALRMVASRHTYDHSEEMLLPARYKTLRGDIDQIARLLCESIQERVAVAGIVVVEARIAHLGYAPEVAQAMLLRQQVDAVIAARRKLVEGALSIVEMALLDINEKGLATFTEAQRVALVTNLMTVLVGDAQTQPILQTSRLAE